MAEADAGSGMVSERTVTQRIASYIVDERFENADAATLDKVKHTLAHHLGLACRGFKGEEPESLRAIGTARELSEGGGTSRVIGQPWRATLVDAALANCQMMRSFSLDDVIMRTGVHPALVVLPVALTLAERYRSSGRDLITSILVGYELMGKFAQWSWSLKVPRRATMPFGAFGGLATASKLLGFDEERTTVALAYGAHMAMGLAEHDSGPISHYYALVCRNVITGAVLTRAGAWGSPSVIEGRFGFIEAFLGGASPDVEAMMASFGPPYAIHETCEKRYPGTGLNQVPIELMRVLTRDEGLRAHDIDRIEIELPVERENFNGGHGKPPFERTTAPSSIAFQFAMLAHDGDLDFARYEQFDDPELCDFAERCHFTFVEGKPIRYARFTVLLRNGERIIREGDHFAFAPYPRADILREGMSGVVSEAKIDRAIELIDGLQQLDDVSALLDCFVP